MNNIPHRPGELDPDPESKPARPDTIDLDEDEKEMLSEARARLANTQGKKAKRKARERQLEESRRLAQLQKRRELKNAGINIKVVTRKPGQMDYNADIPFEKAPAPGFFDTQEEQEKNEKQKEAFDPRKQQLANKRKGDQENDGGEDRKRRKNDKNQPSAAFAAAAKAGQMQKIREAERSSKRRGLNLPAPQVGESELEDIVKMGMAGERATSSAGTSENEATRGLVSNYGGVVGGTPIRTPRAPQEEDRVANEVRNARARTAMQSALLGGDNADIEEGEGTTGYQGIAPSKQATSTPNPMATPYRQGGPNGVGATPRGPGGTPMRTPRDNFRLNDQTPNQVAGQTPREIRLQRDAIKNSLRGKLASLPKPKETEWELELPEEQQELTRDGQLGVEDAAIRDERNEQLRLAAEREEFKRQTQVIQRSLPRPEVVDVDAMLSNAANIADPIELVVAQEVALLVAHDAQEFGGAKIKKSKTPQLPTAFSNEALDAARLEIALEVEGRKRANKDEWDDAWSGIHSSAVIPGLAGYGEDAVDEDQLLTEAFDVRSRFGGNCELWWTNSSQAIQTRLTDLATSCSGTEKKLALHLGGYSSRSKTLRQKVLGAAEALEKAKVELETKRIVAFNEEATIGARLERLRSEVEAVMRRERQAQEVYRERASELEEYT